MNREEHGIQCYRIIYISEMKPKIHTWEKFDFLKSINHSQVIYVILCFLDYYSSFYNFQIYESKHYYAEYCDVVLNSTTTVMNTISNVLFVNFVSDNINSRAGFTLKYEQGM